MLNLCICDDQPEEVDAIQTLAEHFGKEHPEYHLQLAAFPSPYALMDHLDKKEGFDIYLLDVIMPYMMGVELAGHIRERKEPAEIIFLTTSREYAVEAFDVRAAGYLLKPVAQEAFDRVIHAAIEAMVPARTSYLLVKTREGMRKVPLNSLVKIESFDHSRICIMADGSSLETAETLGSLLERLQEDGRFFSPHRAYIVNLEYVNGLSATELLLMDGKRVPVARKLYPALKTAYLNCAF